MMMKFSNMVASGDMAASGNGFLYVIIPLLCLVVIGALFIFCVLQFAKPKSGETAGLKSGQLGAPVARTSSGARGATGTMPTQSSLASSSNSLQRGTMHTSPIIQSIRQPV